MEHPRPLYAVNLLQGMPISAGRQRLLQSWDAGRRGGTRIIPLREP